MAEQPSVDGLGIADQLHRVCSAAVFDVGLTGAVVTMRSGESRQAVVAATGGAARAMAELDFTLGEGPSRDCWTTNRPVFANDLTRTTAQWPVFSPAAIGIGVLAMVVIPLQVGAARFGALAMYSAKPRSLTSEETVRCLALAELATEMLLDSSERTADGEIDPNLKSALDFRSEIHQAQGMLMVQLRVGLPTALARMRAHAFATDRDLMDVATDIIEGELDLNDDGNDGNDNT